MNRILNFFSRWQEFVIWLPLLVVLALVGYVVIGAFDRTAGGDLLGLLLELVVRCVYFACVGAAAWLFKRTYLHDLPDVQEQALHDRASSGDAGAKWLLVKDRIEWLLLLLLSAAFLWVSR